MLKEYNEHIKPGLIECYSGPMASGKSSALLKRIDPIRHMDDGNELYIGFKPNIDTRKKQSRFVRNFISWIPIPADNPEKIFKYIKEKHSLVAIDEIQFFEKGIVKVVLTLQNQMKNVVFAGLDSDFKREPFGSMKELMFHANELKKFYAVCKFSKCRNRAYYTQRLIDGKPAPCDSPIISVEGKEKKEIYEPRCLEHHEVPGKKSF